MSKVKGKEGILKATREKQLVTYMEVPIRQSADFLKETLQARRGWKEIFSHEKQGPTVKIALPTKLSFRLKGQIKSFPDKKKIKEYIITKPVLYEKLRGLP